jgi:rhamnosyltransferase subunit B
VRVLVSCVGSAGDLNPFLAVGQVLARRGHQVEVMTSPVFADRVVAVGLDHLPFGTAAQYERIVQQAALWHPRRSFALMWHEMQPQLEAAHAALVARIDPGRTVLVGSTLAWHVRLAQETQAVPALTVHLSPVCIFSGLAPARLPGLFSLRGWPAGWARAVQAGVERLAIDRVVAPGFDALRHRLGLPPVRRLLSRWVHSPDGVACAWPADFAPAQADWPPQAVTTGFPRWPAAPGQVLAPDLAAFLDAGPAPVGFTPGSAMAHGRSFFERALQASAALGQRALLVTPFAVQLPQPLPPWAHHVAYAPFDLLLPRLRALVHHGGIGTGAQALAAGLPQGFAPMAHDQFDNTARWVRQGVGLRFGRRGWARRLQRLLNDPAIARACRHQADQLEPLGAAPARIADRVEALGPQPALATPLASTTTRA